MTRPLQTVVIADDDSSSTTILIAVIKDLGYQLAGCAINGFQAVEMVRSLKPNVILMDIHMPQMDGLEATRQITALGTTSVVMLTGDPDPTLARQAMDHGASAYMLKPFDIAQIGAVLESAWHRFQTILELRNQTRELTETLEMRKLLERAKGILMEQQGFSENEAHKTLQKMSQDQGIPLKELCRSVIQVQMVLGNKAKSTSRRNAA